MNIFKNSGQDPSEAWYKEEDSLKEHAGEHDQILSLIGNQKERGNWEEKPVSPDTDWCNKQVESLIFSPWKYETEDEHLFLAENVTLFRSNFSFILKLVN